MARCKEVAHDECSQFSSPADSSDETRKQSNLLAHSQDQATSLQPLHRYKCEETHFPVQCSINPTPMTINPPPMPCLRCPALATMNSRFAFPSPIMARGCRSQGACGENDKIA